MRPSSDGRTLPLFAVVGYQIPLDFLLFVETCLTEVIQVNVPIEDISRGSLLGAHPVFKSASLNNLNACGCFGLGNVFKFKILERKLKHNLGWLSELN